MMKHHEKEKRQKATGSDMVGAAGLLAELHAARDAGHLSEDEFAAAKQKVVQVLIDEQPPAVPQFNGTPSHSYAGDNRPEVPQSNGKPSHSYAGDNRPELEVNLPRALSQPGGYTEGYARRLTSTLLDDVKISTFEEVERFIRGELQVSKFLDDSERRTIVKLLKRSPEFQPYHQRQTFNHTIVEGDDVPNNKPCEVAGKKTLLLPAYVWVKFKGMKSMSEKQQTIDMAFTLIVYLNFGELGSEEKRGDLESFLDKLHFTVNEKPYKLHDEFTKAEWKQNRQTGEWVYQVTKRMDIENLSFVNVISDRSHEREGNGDHRSMYRMWASFPFDRPNLCFRLELKSDTLKEGDYEGYTLRWNIHEYVGKASTPGRLSSDQSKRKQSMLGRGVPSQAVMVSFKACADSLPNFDLMEEWNVSFPPEFKGRMYYHPLMQIQISLFRHPGSALRTMFFPLMVTNLCTITTLFFRVTDYHDRITTQVTELLAIFAFLNYSASQLPDVPVTTSMDKMIFTSIFMTFIATTDSLFLWMAEPTAPFRIQAVGYTEFVRDLDVVVRCLMAFVTWCWLLYFAVKWVSYRALLKNNKVKDPKAPSFEIQNYVIPQTTALRDQYLSTRAVVPVDSPSRSPPRTPEMQGRLLGDPTFP